MKVLLTQDVDNLGHAGEVKTVADGYGRNFLLPRSMAVIASVGAIKGADRVKNAAVARRAKNNADIESIAQLINGSTVHFAARAGEKGKMFGSITAQHVADALPKERVVVSEQYSDTFQALPLSLSVSFDVHGWLVSRRRLSPAGPQPTGFRLPVQPAPAFQSAPLLRCLRSWRLLRQIPARRR